MPTVRKSAIIDDGGYFGKAPRDVIRWEVPKFDLAQARRVRDPPAAGEGKQACTDSCMPACVGYITGDANL